MNEKMSTFQIVLFGVLVVAIVAGVIVFATSNSGGENETAPITIWGSVSAELFDAYQIQINDLSDKKLQITYTEFDEDVFEDRLIDALASGNAPDAAILTDDMILKHENKLFLIDYEFYPQLDFQNAFIEAGEVLMRDGGVIGLPLTIDPLVMYWNRTILNNVGISQAPKFWDEVLEMVPSIVNRDSTSNINRAAIAMGEFVNINNAKSLLVSLIQQSGNDVIVRDSESGTYKAILSQRNGFKLNPADTAVNYFTQFSNPSKEVYSWNRALPNSEEMFLAGDLAFYFGFASERPSIIEQNPNLNFSVAPLPQSRTSGIESSVGKMNFVAILNQSQNIGAAFDTLIELTEPSNIELLVDMTGLPPVRREVLGEVPTQAHQEVFNRAALITETFLDPNPEQTSEIFKNMIESVVVGRSGASDAVSRANRELTDLFR
jgi:ABC-type glycerol-3-phosphate transport system substrate-binding protein